MLVINTMERVFLFENKGEKLELADPDPKMTPEAVLNFYSNTYAILATAKISGGEIKNDKLEYQFQSVMGTKG